MLFVIESLLSHSVCGSFHLCVRYSNASSCSLS